MANLIRIPEVVWCHRQGRLHAAKEIHEDSQGVCRPSNHYNVYRRETREERAERWRNCYKPKPE